LLDDLEKIKKAFPTEREQSGKKGKADPGDSNKQSMVSFNEPIPKNHTRMQSTVCCARSMGACT